VLFEKSFLSYVLHPTNVYVLSILTGFCAKFSTISILSTLARGRFDSIVLIIHPIPEESCGSTFYSILMNALYYETRLEITKSLLSHRFLITSRRQTSSRQERSKDEGQTLCSVSLMNYLNLSRTLFVFFSISVILNLLRL
jgi:hypothetical protein